MELILLPQHLRNPLPSPPLLCRESSGGLREETSGRCWLSLVTVSTVRITVTPTASSHLGQDLSRLVLLLQDAYFFPLTFTFHIHFWINMYILTKTISWDFGWVWALTWKTDPFAMSLTLKREHRTLTYVFLKFRSVTFCRLIVKVWHSFRFVPGCSIFKWHLKTML